MKNGELWPCAIREHWTRLIANYANKQYVTRLVMFPGGTTRENPISGFLFFFVCWGCVEWLAEQTTFVVYFEIVADICVQAPTIRPIPKAYGTALLRLSGNHHRNTH